MAVRQISDEGGVLSCANTHDHCGSGSDWIRQGSRLALRWLVPFVEAFRSSEDLTGIFLANAGSAGDIPGLLAYVR